MTTVRIRANVPMAGMHKDAEVEVELTDYVQTLIDDGRVSVVSEDGRGAGESAAAEGSRTGPEADVDQLVDEVVEAADLATPLAAEVAAEPGG